MIQVVDFDPKHLETIRVKDSQRSEVPKLVMTYAVTLLKDEKPIAIFGAFFFVPSVIHIWGLISEEVRETPLEFHKTCSKVLQFYESNHKPRRVQIDVKCDYDEGLRWAERLGFEREGIMKRYGPDGSDYWLMARRSLWAQ